MLLSAPPFTSVCHTVQSRTRARYTLYCNMLHSIYLVRLRRTRFDVGGNTLDGACCLHSITLSLLIMRTHLSAMPVHVRTSDSNEHGEKYATQHHCRHCKIIAQRQYTHMLLQAVEYK